MRTPLGRGSGARPWLPPVLAAVADVAIAAVAGAVVGGRPVAGHAEPLEGHTCSFDVVGSIEVRDPHSPGNEDMSDPDVPRGEDRYGARIGNESRSVVRQGERKTATPGFTLTLGG